ncbi:winged helix-turn-helix domain-containing protein [Streptomyces sp. NPDC101213]|uniref:winged helix-turn-helix domain-containing protein n=1 Tax=Streptomyces sp. NPDC101213 TaxID=3366130 RepID=UPI003823FC70
MAITRSLHDASVLPASALHDVSALPAPARHRLRAVDRDEVANAVDAANTVDLANAVNAAGFADVADFLPPGATWLPAPPHTLPTLPGQPPMVGYLVLVPADRQPPFPFAAVPDGPATDRQAAGGHGAPAAGEAGVRIDPVQRTARVGGRELDLTYLEFELLAHLVAHPNRVHTRDRLVSTVWGYGHVGDGRTVDVHIARLRRKLGAEHRRTIRTVRRVGYKYTPPTGS